jgi:hypothetical protein
VRETKRAGQSQVRLAILTTFGHCFSSGGWPRSAAVRSRSEWRHEIDALHGRNRICVRIKVSGALEAAWLR